MKLTPVAHDPFHRPNRKVAKASVDYSHGKPHAHCGICRHYHDHACTIVVGYIEPQMWCELFAKMQRAEGSGIPGFAEGGVPLMRTGPFPEKPEGYEFFGEPGTETKETEGFVPGVGSPAPNYDLSQIPGVGAEGVMPLESTPPESPEQQGIFKPSKYQMEPSLLEAQLGHEPVPEGLAPRIASGEVQIMDSGQFLDTTTGQIIPEEPLTRRTAGFSPVTIDPSGKPELNISKMLDISGSVGGGWVPPGAGKVLGAGIARKIAQTAEDERAIEVPHEGPKTYPEAQPTGAISGPGGIGRDQGLAEAQGAAEAARGPVQPLQGLPQKPVVIGDQYYVPGPLERVHRVAEEYMQSAGMPYEPVREYVPVSVQRAQRIAKAFEDMPHDPNNPEVKAAYDAMINETVAQFHALQRDGIKIEFIKPGMKDPYYDSPRLAAKDVRDNNHLWVFPTDLGFGTEHLITDNPLLARTGIVVDGRELLANDAFRIVHDYFGHLKDGVGFRAAGEENAWRSHSRMYSPLARRAMTTETRGQNSWLNYGPHGAKNRTAKSDETVFADQKIGILPEWAVNEGAADPFVRPLNEAGTPVRNAGVSAPTHPAQTVADPYRMMFPGIYENPRRIAQEAAARVAPEDKAMHQLWGVTRDDLNEMAKGRVGNESPNLSLAPNPRGSTSAQNIQTPKNTQRIMDILEEAGKFRGLAHADAWYVADPIFKRMVELFGPEEAVARYKKFNTLVGMASPGSDVLTEIARGTHAHMMAEKGRFNEFIKHGGTPEEFRRADFPKEMGGMPAHPYHRTSQAGPMAKYLEHGSIQSESPKVPLYVHASGVRETGFQTTGPVGDAHFSRGVGLSDTRKGPTDVQGSFSRAEYQTLQPWWQHEVAGPMGMESVPAQARLWTTLGPRTGVESALGQSKLELLSGLIMKTANSRNIAPEKMRDLILSGKAGAAFYAKAGLHLGLYSAVERAVDAIGQSKASPQQWLSTIKNTPGVKGEELKWMGLEDWLKEQKGTVTKDQVADYVRANQVEVKEVQKGERPPNSSSGEWVGPGRYHMEDGKEWSPTTKFSQWQLPGGESYRELLLTLPPKPPNTEFGKYKLSMEQKYGKNYPANMTTVESEEMDKLRQATDAGDKQNFKSSHYDEPNILAHMRFNDRTIDGKKTLFLEEVQSDWHQKGRKEGYAEPVKKVEPKTYTKDDFEVLRNSNGVYEAKLKSDPEKITNGLPWAHHPDWGVGEISFDDFINDITKELNEKSLIRAREINAGTKDPNAGRVPDAPFKTTWPELAMKRMIKYAAENGYDKIAWTPGEVQAARYDLSKHVKNVEYVPETEHLRAFDHDGKSLIDEQVLPEKLADHLGKDVAEKLLHDPSEVYDSGSGKKVHALNNVDLKVGGEGMAGFYDKMLPAAVNKLVKKYGARVGEGDIRGHQYKGYESFGAGEGPTGSPAIFGIDKNGKWTLVRQNFKSGDEAIKEAEYLNSGGKSQNVHTLDITPALRKGATEEGFPQFASGGQVKPRQSRLTPVAHNPFEVQNAIRRAIHANRSA